MADRRRRRAPASTARVALILALNAAAALALWSVWPSRGAAEAAPPHEPRDESVALALPKPVAVPATRSVDRVRVERLRRDLEVIVAHWMEEARKRTESRVRADTTAVAVHVSELGAGDAGEIALGSDRALRPASNLKLLTTAAALALLGPDWAFVTPFEATGLVVAGELQGDLVVRAAGDPLFDPQSSGDVEHLFAPAIDALQSAGLVAIAGNVVLDEGQFLEPGPAPEWPDASQHWAEYCALAGGFSANRGCLDVVVTPRRAGESARVEIFPRDHGLPESIGVRTEAKGAPNVQIGAKPSGVLVKGTIGASSEPYHASFAHPDPVELFGRALCGALARRGILLRGRLVRARGAPHGQRLAELRTPLERYLQPINAESNNAVADQVFLALAQATFGSGTRVAGARATAQALERLGVATGGFVQVDGSGLSRANRVSARQIAALIETVALTNARSAALYRDSLAVAGRTGTLADRMRGEPTAGRVRGKTGYIAGTSALSGLVDTLDGRRFVFSILVNYPDAPGLNTNVWKPMQDALCKRLVEDRE
jgi:PBP4 family serine-type D-alanyl-D-alanine carboxypeptidase